MGTSTRAKKEPPVDEDHPHAYGDKHLQILHFRRWWGSSPRVWGQGRKANGKGIFWRIIPTRMGTSIKNWGKKQQNWDHPHAYGDKRMHITEKVPL